MALSRVVVLLAVPALLLAGLWLVSGRIFSSYWASIAAGVVWFVAVSAVLGRVGKRRAELRPWLRGAFAVTALAMAVAFYWTSIRETTVDERIVVAAPAGDMAMPASDEVTPRRDVQVAAGRVEAVGHSAEGRAAVVSLAAGGRVLTLADFDIDPGPMVEVRLVAGDDDASRDHVLLGSLKGTRGDQQYRIPDGTAVRRYDRLVFWCVPFSQSLARARLRPS